MRTGLDPSRRALASKFVRALLLVVGVLIAFQAIGFDLTLLSVFGGALGVGIGLGLQKLASNFIACFVILIDRSVRLGDIVTVDNRHGVVTEVTARYVVVRSLDGIEAIVPNETLITTTVLNHTLSAREARVAVAETGIELELGVWISDAENGPAALRSDLNREIGRAFQAAGIGVPVARKELRVVGGPEASGAEPPKPVSAGPESRPPV